MIYTQVKSHQSPCSEQDIQVVNDSSQSKKYTGNFENQTKNSSDNHSSSFYKCNFGKWTMLVLSILLFNILYAIFSKSFAIIILGLIMKAAVLYAPISLVPFFLIKQCHSIETIIQKLHLQVHLYTLKTKSIDLYLDLSEKINFFMVLYSTKQKQQQLNILNRMKDSVSRIELQLEDDQQVKNRSFIVAVKKMQSMPKKCKSYENVGITCDILKGSSQVGKQLLKLLQEKTLTKQRSQNLSKLQEPTKDNFIQQNRQVQRSAIYPSRSQSLQEKIEKIKQSSNIPTSQKKRVNQVRIKETPFIIKRSQTDIGEEFEFEQQSPQRSRENLHIAWNNNSKTHKVLSGQPQNISQMNSQYSNEKINQENESSMITNVQNIAMLDIVPSEKSYNKNVNTLKNIASLGKILESEELLKSNDIYASSNMTQEPTSPRVLPPGLNISSIQQNPIHPFKVNLSSLSNPLILSNTLTQSKILPNSMATSNEYQIISSSKLQSSTSNHQQNILPQKQLSNVSQVKTQTIHVGEHFSEQSSIPNKQQVSINESDYSDMFDSDNEQEDQAKLEIKVEVIVENERQKGLRPRLDICYIELYDNNDVRFMSMHDKLTFSGKLIKMYKKPQNYYDLVILQNQQKYQTKKQGQNKQQQKEVVKKVKFRGQARHFMKYLEKV